MENCEIDELSEAVKRMNLNNWLQNDQNILTFEEAQARLADIEKRASEVHQRVIDDHDALLEFLNKNMRTSAGKKQSEYVQNSVVVQSVVMGASAVATGSSVRDFDKGIKQPLLAESNLEMGDHHIIVLMFYQNLRLDLRETRSGMFVIMIQLLQGTTCFWRKLFHRVALIMFRLKMTKAKSGLSFIHVKKSTIRF